MPEADFIRPILLLMTSAILGVTLVQRLKLSPILGYFLAGLIIGPFGLNLIHNTDAIHALAEIGVAFLLFDIGLHLSFRTLWESRRDFLGLGPFQIIATIALIALPAYAILQDFPAALFIGCALCLSSTAIAVESLKESGEQNSPLGRSALGVLIAQDIFVIFLLILAPRLGAGAGALLPEFGYAVFKSILALLGVALVGRYLLRPLFEWITATKNSEMFTMAALLFVLATAWCVSKMGLSFALGAFLAGLALSESDFCYLVKTEIYPFRGLLLGLFFITVGMSLNWPVALTMGGTVILLLAGLLMLKATILWAISRLAGYCQGFSLRLGLLLSQGSEFAFVLLVMGATHGIFSTKTAQVLQVVVGASMALTPALALLGKHLSHRIEREKIEAVALADGSQNKKVIITGFDAIAQEVAKMLEAEHIEYVAFDGNLEHIAQAKSKGFQVEYADVHRPKTVSSVSVGNARAVVILWDDPEVSLYLVEALKKLNPELPVLVATHDFAHFQQLQQHQLTEVLIKDQDTPKIIAEALMRELAFEEEKIQNRLEKMKREQTALVFQDPGLAVSLS